MTCIQDMSASHIAMAYLQVLWYYLHAIYARRCMCAWHIRHAYACVHDISAWHRLWCARRYICHAAHKHMPCGHVLHGICLSARHHICHAAHCHMAYVSSAWHPICHAAHCHMAYPHDMCCTALAAWHKIVLHGISWTARAGTLGFRHLMPCRQWGCHRGVECQKCICRAEILCHAAYARYAMKICHTEYFLQSYAMQILCRAEHALHGISGCAAWHMRAMQICHAANTRLVMHHDSRRLIKLM